MKKAYINPIAELVSVEEETFMATSGVTGGDGIGYGGVDTDGSIEPSVKESIFEENPFE